ncbi:SDR family oxidoreductase [Cupriavidus pinatubonensis]|uniref:Diacetyl reductase [(S)-acetoin forming] n=1 Tax=Cupriavidus pinatubonensis TaxID=248026 RepID=A0ABM8XSM8_9BURK|nr:SDR family oxidoreductase [Cupriavidus pinatubonensis]CAG9183328.1 Diacetyl reductase [(S)-acetoin forming] [Cupriavidus pinatubonensis]
MWSDDSLNGRRVLITAGASGIGLAIVDAFVLAGARVAVCDVSPESLEALALRHPIVLVVKADVSVEAEVETLFRTIDEEFEGLDVLVNNAGVAGPTGGVETVSLADWQRTLSVNITGQFLCTRAAVHRLRAGKSPAIVNMSSSAGHLGMPGRTPYSASKWAVTGFTKSLALELGPSGIRVNAVLPGAVEGPRIRSVIAAKAEALGLPVDEVSHRYTSQAALGRMVTMNDIANMVRFACSDLAASVHGQELVVDGFTQALN